MGGRWRRWPGSGRTTGLLLAGTLLIGGIAGTWADTAAWGAAYREADRLLPGTSIAGVPVGDLTRSEARDRLAPVVAELLDHTVVLAHPRQRWTTSARELAGETDLEVVLAAARTTADVTATRELIGMRWLGHGAEIDLPLTLTVPAATREALASRIALQVDRRAEAAEVAWSSDGVRLRSDRNGEQVDVPGLAAALGTALAERETHLVVPTSPVRAELTATELRPAIPAIRAAVDAALDRPIEITHPTDRTTVRPRELGAVPDPGPAAAAALAGLPPDVAAARVTLHVASETVRTHIDELADLLDVAPRNARLDTSTGWVRIVPGAAGEAVDRDAAVRDLIGAVEERGREVTLAVAPVPPAVTRASYRQVLLVRQDLRELFLYQDGEVVRSWPVAVGTGGSPTPTGTFVVGSRRSEPTWVNPAPDRWGRDLPAVIGPGPDNPLGLRALDWHRPGGGDTLIRFHGTPNEASIGEAASNGCVRLRNADVVELYDLVSTGTIIVSLG